MQPDKYGMALIGDSCLQKMLDCFVRSIDSKLVGYVDAYVADTGRKQTLFHSKD